MKSSGVAVGLLGGPVCIKEESEEKRFVRKQRSFSCILIKFIQTRKSLENVTLTKSERKVRIRWGGKKSE